MKSEKKFRNLIKLNLTLRHGATSGIILKYTLTIFYSYMYIYIYIYQSYFKYRIL